MRIFAGAVGDGDELCGTGGVGRNFCPWTALYCISCIVKVKVCILDIAPLCETSPQKRSGLAHVLKGSHSFTCTPTRSSAIGMSHTCLYLPSYSCSWFSFTDPGGMEGWVGKDGWLRSETPKAVAHPSTSALEIFCWCAI